MLVELIEVINSGDTFTSASEAQFVLQKLWVNPDHITHMRPEIGFKTLLKEGKMPTGLKDNAEFTRISIAAGSSLTSVVVVGSKRALLEKLRGTGKQLIQG